MRFPTTGKEHTQTSNIRSVSPVNSILTHLLQRCMHPFKITQAGDALWEKTKTDHELRYSLKQQSIQHTMCKQANSENKLFKSLKTAISALDRNAHALKKRNDVE